MIVPYTGTGRGHRARAQGAGKHRHRHGHGHGHAGTWPTGVICLRVLVQQTPTELRRSGGYTDGKRTRGGRI